MARMRLLVTGGAGFIGSHLVDALLDDHHDVTVVDNFDPFYARALKERNIARHRARPQWRLVEADIRDPGSLGGTRGPFDAVVHLAAKAGVRPSIADPLNYQAVNVAGTQNLLEWAVAAKVPLFVFASSSSVYGVNPRVPWSEADHVLQPISPYASTKVSGELLGHVYSHLYGLAFIALRFFTVYGPRQRPDLAIHKFARMIQAGQPIPMFGDGSTRRDYTYVADIVSGIRSALAWTGRYDVVNLGNNQTVSLAEMIAALEGTLGRRAIIERHPPQPGDVPQTWADVTYAKTLLGYSPRTAFPTGVQHFCDWLKEEERSE
jgi:UDP-glucuronate 4-epimerase